MRRYPPKWKYSVEQNSRVTKALNFITCTTQYTVPTLVSNINQDPLPVIGPRRRRLVGRRGFLIPSSSNQQLSSPFYLSPSFPAFPNAALQHGILSSSRTAAHPSFAYQPTSPTPPSPMFLSRFAPRFSSIIISKPLTSSPLASTYARSFSQTAAIMGFTKTILREGSGPSPQKSDTVTIEYTGFLKDTSKPDNKGTVFDTSVGKSDFKTAIGVGRVIRGWDDGVVTMKLGEKATLDITSDFAYGDRGFPGVIPPRADLIFDVELKKIN